MGRHGRHHHCLSSVPKQRMVLCEQEMLLRKSRQCGWLEKSAHASSWLTWWQLHYRLPAQKVCSMFEPKQTLLSQVQEF